MTFDPVSMFIGTKRDFAALRGTGPGPNNTYYPLTTTMDAFVFSRDFFDATQKSEDGILEKGAQELATRFGAGPTQSYANAVAAWKATWPSVWDAMAKSQDPFWNNQMFWEQGIRYAIARSALGSVPGHWDMLVDSVAESAADLVDKVKAVLPRVDWWKWGAYGLGGYLVFQALSTRAKSLGAGK
ncbi:MAG: hypothetical protein MUQ65_16735 [Armatimonadetes bacterium]|nr:hypothetical protein [Armatimonadota bacterium]